MESKKETNDRESDSTILVRVYINKEFLKRDNLDVTEDVWRLVELDHDVIHLDRLREDIPNAFRKAGLSPQLFRVNEYGIKFYSYDSQKADTEIKDDDDLQNEVHAFHSTRNKYLKPCLKLRVVFEHAQHTPSDDAPRTPVIISPQQHQLHHAYTGTPQHHPHNPISSSSSDLPAPQLRLK
eukprot:183753_1